jgi:hypothetical protein
MASFLMQTIARAFAQLTTGALRQIVRAVVWAALIVSASEAAAQQPTDDLSANAWFLGCKAFVEGRTPNAQLNATANFCSGVVHGLAYIGNILPPELQFCTPAGSTAQQLARVVLNYIEARPQRMHEDFSQFLRDQKRPTKTQPICQ